MPSTTRRALLGVAAFLPVVGCAQIEAMFPNGMQVTPVKAQELANSMVNGLLAAGTMLRGNLDAAGQAALDKYTAQMQAANASLQAADPTKSGWQAYLVPGLKIALQAASVILPLLALPTGTAGAVAAVMGVLSAFLGGVPVAPAALLVPDALHPAAVRASLVRAGMVRP